MPDGWGSRLSGVMAGAVGRPFMKSDIVRDSGRDLIRADGLARAGIVRPERRTGIHQAVPRQADLCLADRRQYVQEPDRPGPAGIPARTSIIGRETPESVPVRPCFPCEDPRDLRRALVPIR